MVKTKLIAKYFTVLENNTVLCKLCPNMCVIPEGKAGVCTTRINVKGKLYSTVYGFPCSMNVDPIEKKPLYHYYPGTEILSLGTLGCNLFCRGCQNFDISRADATKKNTHLPFFSAKEIIKIALDNNIKLIAYTYNEPTIFFEYMLDIAKLAKKSGIKNVIVSNGYINPEPLTELCKYIDAANIDLKGITDAFYKQYSNVHLAPILKTIKTLHENKKWIELTNLIIPQLNDNPKDIKKLCEWIKDNVGPDVPLHFSKFHPYYNASNVSQTPSLILEKAKKIAQEVGLNYTYIGNLGFLDATVCHKCKNTIISRDYKSVDSKLKGKNKNECSFCNNIIPGVYK